jgi:hypothetical protein|tara:strand:- start:277 stop:579 length:303 start_codon:yes stop_codon:yes gene_type:complete
MNPSNPFERKVITLPTFTVKGTKSKSKKKRLSSDLLEKKLQVKAARGFHKDMKETYPIDSIKNPASRSATRKNQHSRRVGIRKAQEAFQTAKKSSRKAKK